MKTIIWTLAIMVGLLLSVSPAEAQTINACVKRTSGRVRIVGVPGQCKSNEAAVSWNEVGAQGVQGPQGEQGDPGPSPQRFELVGFTTAQFNGSQGFIGFALACQVEFSGSRMCDTVEVIRTTLIPTGLSGTAWVNPSGIRGALDPSGLDAIGCIGGGSSPQGHWSNAGTAQGLTVDSAGKFSEAGDCSELHSVACCAPAP